MRYIIPFLSSYEDTDEINKTAVQWILYSGAVYAIKVAIEV